MHTVKHSGNLRKLVLAAACLALCLLLPFLTGQIPQIGTMLAPMHLPVLLCGFLCGPLHGVLVGAVAPLLRYALFGAPVIFPMGISMSFELMTYGLVTGLLYQLLPKKLPYLYVSLVGAMLSGRVVWGCVRALLSGASEAPFTWQAFLAGAFTSAIPGIILQLILVPALVLALRKAKLMED